MDDNAKAVLLKEKFKEQKVPTGVRCQMEIETFKIIFNKEIKDQVRVHFGSYDKEEDMHPYMTEKDQDKVVHCCKMFFEKG